MGDQAGSTIIDYSKSLRFEDIENLTNEELQRMALDLDHKLRETRGTLRRTNDQLTQLTEGITKVLRP